jgi:nucleoid-associated protein YgaU
MFKELQKRFASTDSYVSLVLGIAVVLVVGVVVYNFIQGRRAPAPTTPPPATTDEERMETGTPGGTHTVSAGETLWSISEKYYKTGYNWVDLVSTNNLANPDRIEEGQQLVIPTVTPIIPQGDVSSGETVSQPAAKSYTVVAGDSLWKIAVAQYANGYKWPEIARANSLANPDLIHAGNVLTLP